MGNIRDPENVRVRWSTILYIIKSPIQYKSVCNKWNIMARYVFRLSFVNKEVNISSIYLPFKKDFCVPPN